MSRRTISRWLFLVMSASVLLLATGAATGGASRVSRGSVLWAAVAAPPAPPPPEAASPAAVAALQQAVAAWLPALDRASHLVSTDTITVRRSSVVGNQVGVYFLVKQTSRLDYRAPEDTPVLKGFADFLAADGASLTPVERAIIEDRKSRFANLFQRDISTPVARSVAMKATGALAPDGGVVPGSVELYVDGGEGDYIPAAQLLQRIPSPAAVEADVANGLAAFARQAARSLAVQTANPRAVPVPRLPQPSPSLPPPPPQNVYNGDAAGAYADWYTSDATQPCPGGLAVQDRYYWNSAYAGYDCNDCANYVSQSLYAGGVPQSSAWQPGTVDWFNVVYLRGYMTDNGYWSVESYSTALRGDAITLGNLHTMMVVDNSNAVLYRSAHTDDVVYTAWYGRSDASYWSVAVYQSP